MRPWLLRGTLAVLLLLGSAVLLAPLGMRPPYSEAPLATPGEVGLDYRDLRFTAADGAVDIAAWWIPSAGDARGVVLVQHGFGSNRASRWAGLLSLYRLLHEAGYAVLTLDARSHGASDIDSAGYTLGDREAYDLVGALDWLEQQQLELPVVAMGFSMGGNTVLYAAARDPRVDAVVTLDTMARQQPAMRNAFKAFYPALPDWLIRTLFWLDQELYGHEVSGGLPTEVIGDIAPRPVLLLQDLGDTVVTPDNAEDLQSAYPAAQRVTFDPLPREHPLLEETGLWGEHVMALRARPDEFMAALQPFLEQLAARPQGAN